MRMMLHPPRAARRTAPDARTPVAQAKLAVGAPGDRWERDADRVADAVMRGPTPGGAGARVLADGEAAVRRMPADGGGAPRVSPAADAHVRAATRNGAPLPPSLRGMFEGRMGADLGGVRVHTGDAAQAAARALGARAFTVGRDIVFGAGEYAPGTARGQRLVAHELAHTLQQQALGPDAAGHVLQRQPAPGSTSAPAADITVADIFPFPVGARVVLGRIMPDLIYRVLAATDPATTDSIDAVNGKEARVTSATPDLFEAVVGTPVELPARNGQPARTLRDATVRLERSGGTFNFSLSAQEGTPPARVVLSENLGLTARRDGGSIVLSSGTAPNFTPQLRLTQGTEGQVDLAAFTGPILAAMANPPPAALVPREVNVLRIRRLPDAATRADVQRATESIAATVRPRRQQVSLGAGFSEAGGRYAPLFTAGWQIRFPIPHAVVGQFLQIPLELQVQYAPSEGVLGSVTSGANLHIPTSVPVNVTLIGGVGGGQIQVPGAIPGTVDTQGALGPVLGGGAGVELGTFRVNLRYEHLFNLLPNTSDVNMLSVGLGRAF